MHEYVLRKIAVTATDCDKNDDCFYLKDTKFRKIIDCDIDSLFSDIKTDGHFRLRIVKVEASSNSKYLCLALVENFRRRIHWDARYRILSVAFDNFKELCLESDNIQEDEITITKSFYITSQLYDLLRDEHDSEMFSPEIQENVQHLQLNPTLRNYQAKAVRWCLQRERVLEKIPDIYKSVKCPEREDVFFINIRDLSISSAHPGDAIFPSGGILADEMGLGKTVEILALFLLNPRNLPETKSVYEGITKKRKIDKTDLNCICTSKKKRGTIVTCIECGALQHNRCVRKFAKNDEHHLCPSCWEGKDLIESGATVIVSPHPIKRQWYSEIKKHIKAPLKLLMYEGISQRVWISPAELAEYDIILTDYNILRKEINFSSSNKTSCQLRKSRTYMRVSSPLVMVRWWRVCLDEAQMVESSTTQLSQMVRTLPAIHRWSVTGTPIQKSIEDLRGLLLFLNVAPFYEDGIFENLVSWFQQGNTKPLLDVLKKIMWRTCKHKVLEELKVPPQSEEVHYIVMTDVEQLYYDEQHHDCASVFEEKAWKLASNATSLSKMNPKTLKLLLDPLKKLRQDCAVPVLFLRSEQSVAKRLLRPEELLEHLKSTNENECKSQLRTIASCYNGMAAIHFIRNEIPEAIKLYEAVLRRAREHTGVICVDSLLQIHALHNLVEAHEVGGSTNAEKIKSYKEQYIKLEWKYLETCNNNLRKVELSYKSINKSVEDAEKILKKNEEGNWWREILSELELRTEAIDQLILRINEERSILHPNSFFENLRSVHGIDYILTLWLDKIINSRKNVLKTFLPLKEFTENVKPKTTLSEEQQGTINNFVKNTFDCHLVPNKTKNKSKNVCDLCKAKRALSNLECLIFSMILDEKKDCTEGSWNPTLQETIMKIICTFARQKGVTESIIKEGEEHLHLIDCMKKEYKELGKVWIETEFTVKAFDELNMCKLRLQAVDEEEESENSNYIILKHQVDSEYVYLKAQLDSAELEFVRKFARLKYLRHLETKSDPGICPICNSKPEIKYTVLECGHHLCTLCLASMRKYQKVYLTCSVCRNQQKFENVFFVTCKPTNIDNNEITVRGQYSSKVEDVVRTALRLKSQDENVKILIFSHWEAVLKIIANALMENDISHKLLSSKNSIADFKDTNLGITCLLLLLAQGSKGLNLIEATHVFLVEPILNPGEELQAIGRVHRIGQTRPTTVHRFICRNTIEEKIFNTVSSENSKMWELNDVTIDNIRVLFSTNKTK